MATGRRRSPALAAPVAALAAGLLAAAHAATPALAVSAPDPVLRVGKQVQQGGLVWEEWIRQTGPNECVGVSEDGTGEFPKPLRLAPGDHRARFVFDTRRAPRKVTITAWRAVDASGQPMGQGTELPSHLSARRRDDGTVVVWRAFFHVAPPPDYYLQLYARWRPVCGGPRHLLRTYHVGSL